MRVAYPSDVTRAEFEVIRYYFDTARKVTHPRTIDLYDIFCAVLYVLREGCRWRSLPHDYPKWQNCYKHYKMWAKKGFMVKISLTKLLKNWLCLNALSRVETQSQP